MSCHMSLGIHVRCGLVYIKKKFNIEGGHTLSLPNGAILMVRSKVTHPKWLMGLLQIKYGGY